MTQMVRSHLRHRLFICVICGSTWTAAGQLYYSMTPETVTGPYDHVWTWYDGGGRRFMTHLATTVNRALDGANPDSTVGFRTYYVYDGSDVAFTLVKPSSGTTWRIQQRYVNTGLDENVAARLWLNGTPTSLALVTDRQGGYIMGVKANGTEETSTGFYLRNAFGKVESGSSMASSLETHTGLGFAGAGTPTSAGGGYVYLRNRWYDPQTGRFLSQDPIGLAGGVNLYAYAGNNPVAYSDPFGLQPCPPACLDGVSTSIALFQGMWQRAEEVVHSAVDATKSAFDAVASRVSVYARGKMGVETARAEVNLDGTYALRTQPEVGSGAVEGAVGADVRISDPPPGSVEIQASYTLKVGKGPKGGLAASVTTAVGKDGSHSVTAIGVEYVGGIDFTPGGVPARFGAGIGLPGKTCGGTACNR